MSSPSSYRLGRGTSFTNLDPTSQRTHGNGHSRPSKNPQLREKGRDQPKPHTMRVGGLAPVFSRRSHWHIHDISYWCIQRPYDPGKATETEHRVKTQIRLSRQVLAPHGSRSDPHMTIGSVGGSVTQFHTTSPSTRTRPMEETSPRRGRARDLTSLEKPFLGEPAVNSSKPPDLAKSFNSLATRSKVPFAHR
jgi:hypothetical protein